DLEPARAARHDVKARIAVRFDTEPPWSTQIRPAVDRRANTDGIKEVTDDLRRGRIADRLHTRLGRYVACLMNGSLPTISHGRSPGSSRHKQGSEARER